MSIILQILPYILILIFSMAISFVLKGLTTKFLKEEELCEQYEEEHKEELSQKLSRKEIKYHKKEIRKLKSKFAPKFSIAYTIATFILLGFLYYFHHATIDFFRYAILTLLLEISFVTDIKMCIIPNETNLVGGIVGFLYALYMLVYYLIYRVNNFGIDLMLGGIVALLIFVFIGAISYLILKKEGMGGGDIKLVLVIGFFMGLRNFVQVFVLSFLIAAIVSIPLLILKKKNKSDYIPFGPFLCIGTYITMLIPAMATATIWMKMFIS